mmetsp:Transcript_28815/g.37860  ORF Transcript_28815/g.37860 Transcript_28815/m.37860 type:complete len:554 (+) Transcript_28815:169-1830(+)
MADRTSRSTSQNSVRTDVTARRKQKALAIREREIKRASNDRLKAMLIQKLTSKYGTRQPKSKLNRDIEAMVSEAVSNSREVNQVQLQELENRVRAMTMGPGSAQPSARPGPLPSQNSREVAAAIQEANGLSQQFQQQLPQPPQNDSRGTSRGSRNQLSRPGSNGLMGTSSSKSLLEDDWTLLDAYAIVQTEEQMRAEYQKIRQKKQEFKHELDHHIQLKQTELQKQRDEERKFIEQQKNELDSWEKEQARLKKEMMQKNHALKEIRQQQIVQRESQRAKDKQDRMNRELRELQIAQAQLKAQQDSLLKSKQDERERLQGMWMESQKDKEAQELLKLKEAQQDLKLMEAYRKKLEVEEQARQSAFTKRMERYEKIGKAWEEDGAGKKQREVEVRLEKLLLAEQEKKEKADRERQEREFQQRRLDKLRCVEENQKLVDEKKRLHNQELQEEAAYAQKFIEDTKAWKREQLELEKSRKMNQAQHKESLMKQMAAKEDREQKMSEREQIMNQGLLDKLHNDPDLLSKVQEKLPSMSASNSTQGMNQVAPNNIFGGGY